MQRRIEPRQSIPLPVRVWGMDGAGKPFTQNARTRDVSPSGAGLEDLCLWKTPGEVIGMSHGNEKARYRVMWIGMEGTAREGLVGVRCLESGRNIWGDALRDAPKVDPAYVPKPIVTRGQPKPYTHWPETARESKQSKLAENRRQYARYDCTGGVQVRPANGGQVIWGKVVDLSLGGCYVEAYSTLPQGTEVELNLGSMGTQVIAQAQVTMVHPAFGFAVQFTMVDPVNRDALQGLIIRLAESGQYARSAAGPN